MKIFYTDHFVLPLPAGHRFPMAKYSLLRQRVTEAGLVPPENLRVPDAATDEQILRAHSRDYLERVKRGELTLREIRRLGFPWSPQLVERSRRSVGATIEACRAALQNGVGVNLAGGTHHAFHDHGEGYCVYNDSVVAARTIQAEERAQRIVIIDCDVHQGNGTAAILTNDPTIFTFSIHGAKNYPYDKEKSDLDIALPDGTDDAGYLEALDEGLQHALELAEADLAIYLAGADPYIDDKLGRLTLTKAGLAERDRLVFNHCHSAGIPMAVTMAGGYARQIEDIVDIHFRTVRIASEMEERIASSAAKPAPIEIPEVDAKDLIAELKNGKSPLLLDCREPIEWQQTHIPNSRHMPMYTIPYRLDELDHDADIVVLCAHGIRSYTVAGFLIQNGFSARSLEGGLAMWQHHGGDVESNF